MKVNELVESMKKNQNATVKKFVNVKEYVPMMEKYQFARTVFEHSTSIHNGIFVVDSMTRYIGFTMGIIDLYTDIEFGDDPFADYDLLCQNGLLEQIIALFETEYNRTLSVTNDVFNDALAANNTIEAIVAKLSANISNKLDDVLDNVNEQITNNFENVDLVEFGNMVQQLKQ